MAQVSYVDGDVLQPQRLSKDNWCVIAQVVNNVGAFGAGLAAQTAKQFPEVKKRYRNWTGSSTFKMGANEYVIFPEQKLCFALMLCQDGLPGRDNPTPLRYPALQQCLKKLGLHAEEMVAEVHMPKIGCGIARGRWGLVCPYLVSEIPASVPVIVYEREKSLRLFANEMLADPWPENPKTQTSIHSSVYRKVKFT
jgi:O-acetyl-ADP-ribose deacetylase (regulator of RNase III)